MNTPTIIHAPHLDNGRSFCGAVEYDSTTYGQPVTCTACIELQLEYCQEMAEFEQFSAQYYAEVGDLIQQALCGNNAAVYTQRAEECRKQLAQQQAA